MGGFSRGGSSRSDNQAANARERARMSQYNRKSVEKKRKEFKKIGTDKVDNVKSPSVAVNIAANVLKGPLKKGSEITRDFFADNVLNAGKYRVDGKQLTGIDFDQMSVEEQDKAFTEYMAQRSDNKIDAYGNPISRDNDGGNVRQTKNQGIETAKRSGQMVGDVQAAAVDAAPDGPTTLEMPDESSRLLAIKRRGRRKTILSQDEEDLKLGKKTLLG